jgi:UDP-glucose 4-epimerase
MKNSFLEKYLNKRILVTGGNGYLAYSVISLLKNTKCYITSLDITDNQEPIISTKAKIKYVKADIANPEVFEKHLTGIDIIFHFAAQTSVYKANENPTADIRTNVMPMLALLETCRKLGTKPVIIFSGTVTEIGMSEYLPVDEKHLDKPITIYDLHKLMAENYLKYYAQQGIVKGAILRLANVYGPGPKSSSADRGILNMMVKKAMRGEDLTLYGKGVYLRDYVYVKDVAAAFLYVAMKIKKTNSRHYVIGSGKGTTLAAAFKLVTERVAVKLGTKVNIRRIESPKNISPIERRNFIANIRNFTLVTGWKPEYSLMTGIDSIIESSIIF